MITQYEVDKEFTHETEHGILVPVATGVIFTMNLVSCDYESQRNISLGSWTNEMEEKIGDVITITEEFIMNNPYFFKSLTPSVFSLAEIKQFIKDIKEDIDNNGSGYFIKSSSEKDILSKFVKKTIK